MTLTGGSHVQTDRYRLEGEQIDALMDDRELRTVTADQAARVESRELTVDADRIHIGFVEGDLNRMQAWNPVPDSSARALANAEGFRLRADSIDARADSAGMREVRAVGRAYGERDADSLAVVGSGTVTRDWIQGDTILGYFDQRPVDPVERVAAMGDPANVGERPVAGADSTETVLERIVVIGGASPALSLYRMRQEQAAEEPAINFMKAERITLFMDQGDVTRVEADGPLDGLYLSPVPPSTEAGGEAGGQEGGQGGGGEDAGPGGRRR